MVYLRWQPMLQVDPHDNPKSTTWSKIITPILEVEKPMWIEVTQGYTANETDLQLKPTLCLSTITQLLPGTEMLTTLQEVDSVPALDKRPGSRDISLNHRPSVCLAVRISGALPCSESVYMLAVMQCVRHLTALISLFVLSDNYQPRSYS